MRAAAPVKRTNNDSVIIKNVFHLHSNYHQNVQQCSTNANIKENTNESATFKSIIDSTKNNDIWQQNLM